MVDLSDVDFADMDPSFMVFCHCGVCMSCNCIVNIHLTIDLLQVEVFEQREQISESNSSNELLDVIAALRRQFGRLEQQFALCVQKKAMDNKREAMQLATRMKYCSKVSV